MITSVGIVTFMSMINFMFSCVEHGKKFYNLGAWLTLHAWIKKVFSEGVRLYFVVDEGREDPNTTKIGPSWPTIECCLAIFRDFPWDPDQY